MKIRTEKPVVCSDCILDSEGAPLVPKLVFIISLNL
jgi:hypothetical protein